MARIHPTAVVYPTAEIAADAEIGAYSIVEPRARVGAGCVIGAHVTLGAGLRLGRGARVHNYACLGTASQDLKHRGEESGAEIGEDCVIREFVTVNRATREGGVTRVGAGSVLLAYAHVAHECEVGPGALIVNGAQLGGESVIGARAIVGGLAGVHQFCRVGELALVGACSKVTRDVPPFMIADGHPARAVGPNAEGLRRAGLPAAEISEIRAIFHALFARDGLFTDNVAGLAGLFPGSRFAAEVAQFCAGSRRGVCMPRRRAHERAEADVSIYPGAASDEDA